MATQARTFLDIFADFNYARGSTYIYILRLALMNLNIDAEHAENVNQIIYKFKDGSKIIINGTDINTE